MTNRVSRPEMPAQPDTLRLLIGMHNDTVAAMVNGIRVIAQVDGTDPESLEAVRTLSDMTVATTGEWIAAKAAITDWYATPAGQAYRRQVEEYNAQAAAWNAQVKADRQARVNARETAKVRAARCPSCFTVKRSPDAPCVNC